MSNRPDPKISEEKELVLIKNLGFEKKKKKENPQQRSLLGFWSGSRGSWYLRVSGTCHALVALYPEIFGAQRLNEEKKVMPGSAVSPILSPKHRIGILETVDLQRFVFMFVELEIQLPLLAHRSMLPSEATATLVRKKKLSCRS